MSVSVAEYLGVRTDSQTDIIPVRVSKKLDHKPTVECPFRNAHCDKASRGDKPVCSVRDTRNNQLWIVCSHRLCSTSPKQAALVPHQKNTLREIARLIFDESIPDDDILVKREVGISVTDTSNYKADYVMWRSNPDQNSPINPDRAFILEMQGGGETTNTGKLTEHIESWETSTNPTNAYLSQPVNQVSSLETNAWRRQQEQFLVKGNVAMMTGGRIVFCVGEKIYDYLMQRFKDDILPDLSQTNWTLALITFSEDENGTQRESSISLQINRKKTIFTNYNSFVQVLTNQAKPDPAIFLGDYIDFNGGLVTVSE